MDAKRMHPRVGVAGVMSEKDDLLREGEHEVVAAGLHERVGLRVGQPGGGLAIDRGDDFALANRLDGGLAAGIHLQPNGSI